jgi:hypothetical protein
MINLKKCKKAIIFLLFLIEKSFLSFGYLATGDSQKTIAFSYRLGNSTVNKIVMDTCKIVTEKVMSEMLPNPTVEMWKSVGNDFYTLWNFRNCLGALDGKHSNIQAPLNSGSQ